MKVYDKFPFGVLHITKRGLITISHKDEKLLIPKSDERIYSLQPTYSSNVEIVIKTKKLKSWRINFKAVGQNPKIHTRWMKIKALRGEDEIVSAGVLGPVFQNGRRMFDDIELEDIDGISSGKKIILEHVSPPRDITAERRKEREEKRQEKARVEKEMDKKISFEHQQAIYSLHHQVALSTSPSMTNLQISKAIGASIGIVKRISNVNQWSELHAKSWLRAEKAYCAYLASKGDLERGK